MKKLLALGLGSVLVLCLIITAYEYRAIGQVEPEGEGDPCAIPRAQPGYPRAWEGGIPVSTYSVVNAYNLNCITTIPIIGWSGVGPDIEFVLYHNSASVDEDDLTGVRLAFKSGRGLPAAVGQTPRTQLTGKPVSSDARHTWSGNLCMARPRNSPVLLLAPVWTTSTAHFCNLWNKYRRDAVQMIVS
jgi:hypothetical protein